MKILWTILLLAASLVAFSFEEVEQLEQMEQAELLQLAKEAARAPSTTMQLPSVVRTPSIQILNTV